MSDTHCALRPSRRAVLATAATVSFVLGLLLAVLVGLLTECSHNLSGVVSSSAPMAEANVSPLQGTEGSILLQRQILPASHPEPTPDALESDGWTQLTVIATAYDAGKRSTGKEPGHPAYGVTYTGTRALEGRTVAVDPQVIPLGSEVKIPALSPYTYIAEDTGRLIKGNRIDIYMDSEEACLDWGVRTVKVLFRPPKETWGLNRNHL